MTEVRAATPVRLPIAARRTQLPCADDPELFFAEAPDDVETAKALCVSCPVRATCLSGARERREPWGVWGGELFIRGEVVPRKRPRGRPRKTEVAA
ncbi:MAG TPA: WhiB family transcriptional regulator [Streptosporangiaceae bacterium]|nr:WhiB family transcriptional regulator [Streptosporangiaceae bacterium]